MIETLKDIAFRIQIEPIKTVDSATSLQTVIKVLSEISDSYNNFLEIEFLKNESFVKIYENNKSVLKTILEELNLFIVDLNFGSFEAALAPNIVNNQLTIFNNDIQDWKKNTFVDFKDNVLGGDFEDPFYVQKIENRYSDVEKIKIFKPLFSSFGDSGAYKIHVKNRNLDIIKTLYQPKDTLYHFLPRLPRQKTPESDLTNIHVFAKVKKGDGKLQLSKNNLKKILYYEELEHDTYPYKPNTITFDELTFDLSKPLLCEVAYEDKYYFIKNDELNISVWGESREDVEEAFRFSFYSLYINYYSEEDSNLTGDAIILKQKLHELIKNIVNETT